MPYLKVISELGKVASRSYPLNKDTLLIGKTNADVVLDGDHGISRQHARIRKSGGDYLISDAGSKNGTFLNNQPLATEIRLSHEDHIKIGQTILMFVDEATEPVVPSMIVDRDDSKYQGTVYRKADQLAETMVSGRAAHPDSDERRRLAFLTLLGKDVMSVNNEQALGEMLTQRLREEFGADCCAMVYSRPTDTGYDHDILSSAWSTPGASRGFIISETAVNQAIENKMSSMTPNALQDERLMDHDSVIARGINSILCAPLWHEEHIFGLLYMDTADTGRQFNMDHLSLLSHIANLAAIKIVNLRLFAEVVAKAEIEKEMEVAGKIQQRLLPDEYYVFRDIVCVGSHQACLAVGGDYYDFIPFREDLLTVTVADVTGHGYPAGLLMVACKFVLTTLIEAGMPFDDRIDRINQTLIGHCDPNQFITFFHAEIDAHTGSLRYCNAGHNPPILIPGEGDIRTLTAHGPPFGIMEMPYGVETVPFEKKSKIVMYTDGITEAMNTGGDLYEEARLLELVTRHRTQSAEVLKTMILDSVASFSEGCEQLDDVTLTIVEHA